jgi:para-aminobenzoate synthetase component 1
VGERRRRGVVTPAPLAHQLLPAPDPLETYERVRHLPHPILLDSAERGRRGRYSFVAADPVTVIERTGDAHALDAVTDAIAAAAAEPLPGLPPFQGGAAGFVSYEWGSALERLPAPVPDPRALPDVRFGVYDWVIAWDHARDAAWIVTTALGGRQPGHRREEIRALLAAGRRPSGSPPHLQGAAAASLPAVRSNFARGDYELAVGRVRDYILDGDVFQVNLSQQFELPVTAAPLDLYRSLRARHPAAFAALIEAPGIAILSASPERFLRVEGREVETCPIKGTRPRGTTPDLDRALAAELAASAKDQAENVMIVDLMRNDLYRNCLPGTVTVSELCALEAYPTVHHLVSTVRGTLGPGATAAALLRDAFPGGSITGAPKVRAMEIIRELEPARRGIYCGSIGYLSASGAADFSIAIRTATVRDGVASVPGGGGITADSDPAAEYDETVAKVRGVLAALAAA